MPTFSGNDPASRLWRREQGNISNDISGISNDPNISAFILALDTLNISDADRIIAMTTYFKSLPQR